MASIDASTHAARGTAIERPAAGATGASVDGPGASADLTDLLLEALALAPDVASIHTSLAGHLVELGCVGDATRHLRRALALDPLADEARCRLAAILVHEGEVPAALALYLGGPEAGRGVRLRTEFADLLARLGLGDEASRIYGEVLGTREDAPALVNLGIVHARRGDPASAAACFIRAVAADPACREGVLNLANAYVELGRLDEAEEMFHDLDGDEDLRAAACLGRSAIAAARGDLELARVLRGEAGMADRSLAGLCDRAAPAEAETTRRCRSSA